MAGSYPTEGITPVVSAALKHVCPGGIHLSLNPRDPLVWSGVFFVRKGPYESAVLRFRVVLPPLYPEQPPSIEFTSDVFHPLVTPLTTYAGSSESHTFSLCEEDRLPPGGFSLTHAFPSWFNRHNRSASSQIPKAEPGALAQRLNELDSDSDEHSAFSTPRILRDGKRPSKDAQEAVPLCSSSIVWAESVIDALYYMRRSFEDEALLDNLPLEAASNAGAWSAWVAHRRAMCPEPAAALQAGPLGSERRIGEKVSKGGHPPSSWNWEGVWLKRVGTIKEASTSDPVLFASNETDEPIHFLDLDEETIQSIKSRLP